MNRFVSTYMLILLSFLVCIVPAQAEQGYRLIQSSDAHGKKIVLYVSKTQLNWISRDSGISVHARAPWKTVYACNNEKKLVFKCKLEDYQGLINYLATLSSGVVVQELPMKLDHKEVYCRFPVKVYNLNKDEFRKKQNGKTYFRDAQTRQLTLPNCSKRTEKLVRKIYGLPEVPGIPVFFGYVKAPDTKRQMARFRRKYPRQWLKMKKAGQLYTYKLKGYLSTQHIAKVKMPSIPKGIPVGYKLVKVEQDLTRNATAEAGMELMMH